MVERIWDLASLWPKKERRQHDGHCLANCNFFGKQCTKPPDCVSNSVKGRCESASNDEKLKKDYQSKCGQIEKLF